MVLVDAVSTNTQATLEEGGWPNKSVPWHFYVITTVRFTDLDKLNLVIIHNGSKDLGSIQFSLMPQLPHKMTLTSIVVKIDSKIIISLR